MKIHDYKGYTIKEVFVENEAVTGTFYFVYDKEDDFNPVAVYVLFEDAAGYIDGMVD